ncbi:MAG: hypothetical protein HQK55_05760 [Deltaproteobacteria bacterium]|nr:hypothetical protein [Deltaproteobacteria bacterium]
MSIKINDKYHELHLRAEALVKDVDSNGSSSTPEDIKKIFHDLQVHQIEMEMQNDELRRTQLELEESRNRYSKLYNQAPVGYMVMDDAGMVLEVKQTLA